MSKEKITTILTYEIDKSKEGADQISSSERLAEIFDELIDQLPEEESHNFKLINNFLEKLEKGDYSGNDVIGLALMGLMIPIMDTYSLLDMLQALLEAKEEE